MEALRIYSLIYFTWISIYASSGLVLQLKPSGTQHVKNVKTAIVLTCELVGVDEDEPVSINWLFDNNKQITDKFGRIYVEEETNSIRKLYITSIEEKDRGEYKCVAEAQGQNFDKSVRLEVIKDITFESAAETQHPALNTDAVIICVVSGRPEPEISWKLNGRRINLEGKQSRYSRHEKGLLLRNVTAQDNGEYTCRAEVESEGRYDERKITVEVHTPPKITEGPGRVEGVEGEIIQLMCSANGYPAPTYKFFKSGKPDIELVSNNRVSVDSVRGRVDLKPLNKSDEGDYVCSVANDVGSDEAKGHIKVLVKPKIYEFYEEEQLAGQPITLDCRSHGDPSPNITFTKLPNTDAYNLGDNEDGSLVVLSSMVGHMQLFIKSATPAHSGIYLCKSVNSIGQDQAQSKITIKYAPKFTAKQSEVVYIWAGKSRNISCAATGEPTPSFEWLRGSQVISNNSTYFHYHSNSTSNLQVSVREIDQAWIYGNLTCRATNDQGSSEVQIELRRAKTPDVVKSIVVKESLPNGFILEFEAPLETGGEPISSYQVEYVEKDSMLPNGKISSKDDSAISNNIAATQLIGENELQVDNLMPSTDYILYVRAINQVGLGRPVEVKATTEAIRKPYPVKIVSDENGDAFSYQLKWDKINSGGLPLTDYEIRFREVKEENGQEHYSDWTTIFRQAKEDEPMRELLLEHLNPQTVYQVEARSRNKIDWSDYNPLFQFKTREATAHDYSHNFPTAMGGGTIVGIIFISILLLLILIDLGCLFLCRSGITHFFLTRVLNKSSSASDKEKALEEGEKEHLKSIENDEMKKPQIFLEGVKDEVA